MLEFISLFFASIFLLVIISYYFIFFLIKQKSITPYGAQSLSILIPAHNEEKIIVDCIESVLAANFNGRKEVIVIDDGSSDNTYSLISKFKSKIKLIKTAHTGKSAALNRGLEISKGELVAVVDGDSIIEKNSLIELANEFSVSDVVAATGVVKVRNRESFFGMFFHLEQLHNSVMRSLISKINANITTPGPLSMYRRRDLVKINGFNTDGYAEDADVTIRLIRLGGKVGFCDKAISITQMPEDLRGVVRQRLRFAKGSIYLFKKNFRINSLLIDVYSIPLLLFFYLQAIIMGLINIFNISYGYFTYFVSNGLYFNFSVFVYFFKWISIFGFLNWIWDMLIGVTPLTTLGVVAAISSLLVYPFYFLAIFKYDKKIDIFHIIPLVFLFPFWIFMTFIYVFSIFEVFNKSQPNRWEKNA